MKTKKFLYLIMMVLAVFAISCDDEAEESCNKEDLAEDFGCPVDVDAIATFCSDGVNDSYYTYSGTDYYCDGVDAETCDAAIQQVGIALIKAGCGTKKSVNIEVASIKLSKMAEELLNEVRNKSLCN